MKKLWIFVAAGLTCLPLSSAGAQSARARLFCLSLRFQQGRAVDSTGFLWKLDLTTLSFGINGELAPDFFGSGYSNSTYIELYSELIDDTFPGAMALNLPNTGDVNGNGFSDFFDVSQPVNGLPSSGSYNISSLGSGAVNATWYRDAGSSSGTCVLRIRDPFSLSDLVFTHAFALTEYTGALFYTPGSNTVAASVSLTETNSGNTLAGPVQFVKSATNRFNQMTLQGAFLTNAASQTLDLFMPTPFVRSAILLTNYHGPVEFNDGDPGTAEDDYYRWELSIDDPNDTDHDGVPDFSDDPQSVTGPRRPVLSLARSVTNLLLTIGGDVGHLHQIQEGSTAASTNWQTVLSVTLTNDPQVVSLPLPASGMSFWRAQAQ